MKILSLVLNNDFSAEEKAAAKRLAEIQGLSVSNMLRELVRVLYKRKLGKHPDYNPALFQPNYPGGLNENTPWMQPADSPAYQEWYAKTHQKKGDKRS